MNTPPDRPPLRVSTPADLLAVIPHVLGFIIQRLLMRVWDVHDLG